MPLRIAAVLAAAVGQYAQQLDLVAIQEGNDSVIQQISPYGTQAGPWILAAPTDLGNLVPLSWLPSGA